MLGCRKGKKGLLGSRSLKTNKRNEGGEKKNQKKEQTILVGRGTPRRKSGGHQFPEGHAREKETTQKSESIPRKTQKTERDNREKHKRIGFATIKNPVWEEKKKRRRNIHKSLRKERCVDGVKAKRYSSLRKNSLRGGGVGKTGKRTLGNS